MQVGSAAIQVAALVSPGTAADVIGLTLGYGRRSAGRVGNGVGFNAYKLLESGPGHPVAPFMLGLRVEATGRQVPVAAVHTHHLMHGRDLVLRRCLLGR